MPRVVISGAEQVTHVRQPLPVCGMPWRNIICAPSDCDFWQVAGTLTLKDVDTERVYKVQCLSYELPTITSAVVFQVQLTEDESSVTSRPSPLCSLGHLSSSRPSVDSFVFDDICAQAEQNLLGVQTPAFDLNTPNLARRLFLARYMPMSSTCAIVGLPGSFERVSLMVKQKPWVMFLEGYIDCQGLQQALVDYDLEAALLQRLGIPRMPNLLWWAHVFQAYMRIDKVMAFGGSPRISCLDEATKSACRVLTTLGVLVPTGEDEYVSRLQNEAHNIIKMILGKWAENGRKAAHPPSNGDSIFEALRTRDLLVVDLLGRYHASVSHELTSIMSNALLVLSRHNNSDQGEVRRQFEAALHSGRMRHPVVVIVDAHTWSSTDLTRCLLPIAATPQVAENGRYPFTGSGVPFQLLFVYNSIETGTAWMRAAVKGGALPITAFYPRAHETVASSTCPVYSELREAVLGSGEDLDQVFRRTCRELLSSNEDALDPDAKVCSLHEACPLKVCRALPATDEGLPPEVAAHMATLRSAVHVKHTSDIQTILRTHSGNATNIFLYPDPVSGAMPSQSVVCTAMCEAECVYLVAEPAERFPRLIDLFGL